MMEDRKVTEEPVEDRVGEVGGVVMLFVVLFLIAMGTGAAGVMLAGGALVVWAVFTGIGSLIKKNRKTKPADQ